MKLTLDEIRVVRRMRERGAAVTHLAKDLGVTEGAVRYRLKPLEEGDGLDGRAAARASVSAGNGEGKLRAPGGRVAPLREGFPAGAQTLVAVGAEEADGTS